MEDQSLYLYTSHSQGSYKPGWTISCVGEVEDKVGEVTGQETVDTPTGPHQAASRIEDTG